MLHDKMTKEELLTLALFDNGGIDDTDLYRDTTDSTYESVKTLSNCGAFPMLSLKVGIEAVQSGSGDPSPTNVRPISGWDECKVEVVGKNLVESTLANTTIYTNGEISVSDGSSTFDMHIAKIIKGETYTVQSDGSVDVDKKFVGGFFYDMPQIGSISYNGARLANTPATFIAPIDGYVAFRTSHEYATPQCEVGNQSTEYTPYNPNSHTYTIDLDGTRYGGKLDVVSGVLTVTHGYIASYNGETLPSTWISDRDVYAEGTTPSTGAEVVYELATPTTIQLTPTQVKSLLGTNNIWADTGDVGDARYFKKVEL